MSKKVAVYRKEHFNAAHRLNNPIGMKQPTSGSLVNAITRIFMAINTSWCLK
jgi:hypothetical protein